MNPCRCGHYPDLSRCTCTAGEVSRYLGKISGPLLDRMDICVEAQAVTYEEMEGKAENESSASIRARVEAHLAIQRERFKGLSIRCNGEMGGGQIRRFCPLNKEESEFMEHIFFSLGISIRMYGKILKVARTRRIWTAGSRSSQRISARPYPMCGSGSGTGKTVRGRIMTEKEYLYLLLHAAGTGAVSAQRLYEHFGSYEHIWKAEKRELERSGLLSHGRLSGLLEARLREEELREDFAALEKRGLRFIAWWEEGYPGRLLPFRDRPAGLFVRGTLPAKDRFTAAIVGARSCTELGRQTAERLAFRLAEAGVQVISGLALGIDGAAHKGALEAGGKTFAVLGCGADRCYPRENYGLFKKMELQGGVLSEFVPGTSPLPMNFPMRNRIISGLSDAVILVEAREKSGSLITADLALEQGKEVFAVPGRITDPQIPKLADPERSRRLPGTGGCAGSLWDKI